MPQTAPMDAPHPLLAKLACPKCRAPVGESVPPTCTACDFTARDARGIWDFVDETGLTAAHEAEMTAQAHAVDEYYENERKLACHFDRRSAQDLQQWMPVRPGWILDLGCGTGTAGAAYVTGASRVVGADLSLACLEAAVRRLDHVVRADAAHLPFQDEAFDAIVSRGALHHLADPAAALAEAARVLKPGAPALFVDPREFRWLEPVKAKLRRTDESFTDDHHAYNPDEYADLVAPHFEIDGVETGYPLGIALAAVGDLAADRLPVPIPPGAAGWLHQLDRLLNRTPGRRLGHLVIVRAHRR